MKTHELTWLGLPRLFVSWHRVPWYQREFGRSHAWEIDGEHRFGRGVIIRLLLLPWAVGIGWWGESSVENLESEAEIRRYQETSDVMYDRYVAVNGPVSRKSFNLAWFPIYQQNRILEGLGDDPEVDMYLLQEALIVQE